MEYLGYTSRRGDTVDWTAATSGLAEAVTSVDTARKAKRAEDAQILKESEQLINETEQPKNQTLNDFLLKGTYQGKSKLYDWNKQLKEGKISRDEYKSRVANLNDYWDNLAGATKSFDQRLTQAMERQQVGEDGSLPPASAIEAEMQGYFAGLSDLQGKGINIGDDGRVSIAKYGPSGEVVSYEDVKSINNPANVAFNRIDLNGMVNAEVKNWEKWGLGRTTDTRQNPAYLKAKNTLLDTLTTNPRSAASILVDNSDGDYTVFFGEEDYNQKFNNLKSLYERSGIKMSDENIASQLIQMKQDANGDYQPVLTPKQIEEAKKIVDNQIEIQVGRDVAPAPYYGGGGSNDLTAKQVSDLNRRQQENLYGYEATGKAWVDGVFSNLKQGYNYEWTEDSKGRRFIRITTGGTKKIKNGKKVTVGATKVKDVYSADGLAEFAFNGDPNQAISDWHDGRKLYQGKMGRLYGQGGSAQPINNNDPTPKFNG